MNDIDKMWNLIYYNMYKVKFYYPTLLSHSTSL